MINHALACLQRTRASFEGDPPTSDFQIGYLKCLDDVLAEFTRPLVDEAIEDAAQVLVSSNVPLARVEDILLAIQGSALRMALEMRIEQVVKHGHTAETDVMHPILWLPKQTVDMAQLAHSRVGVTGDNRNLPAAQRAAARTAALAMASIDRIQAAIAAGG